MNTVIRALLVVGSIYLAYAAVAFLLQRRLLYPGTYLAPVRTLDPDSVPDVERVWIDNGDGRSEAWALTARSRPTASARDTSSGSPEGTAARPAVLYLHGNGEFIDDWLEPLRALPARGLHVLLLEYPGYGRSTGRPSKETILRSATAAYDHLAERADVDARRIVLMGRSLGGGVAAELARRRPAVALVLQSTFTSVGALAARAYLLPPLLVRDRFRTRESLRSYDGPVLILHGRHDRIIPFSHGEALARSSAEAHLLPLECGHNDCPPSWPDYWVAILDFLEAHRILLEGEGGTDR